MMNRRILGDMKNKKSKIVACIYMIACVFFIVDIIFYIKNGNNIEAWKNFIIVLFFFIIGIMYNSVKSKK